MPISLITLYIPRKQRKCMDKKSVYEQLKLAKIPADIKLVEESEIDVENIEKSKPQKCVARGVCLQKIVETNAIPETVGKPEDFLVAADCQCSIICNGWITEGGIEA